MIPGRSSLVVHSYGPASSKTGEGTSFFRESILSKGRDLVSAAESADGWRTVGSPSDSLLNLGEKLVSRQLPPSFSSLRGDLSSTLSVAVLKECSDKTDARALDVSKLKEFEGTDFSFLLERESRTKHLPASITSGETQRNNRKRKRTHEAINNPDDAGEQREEKRRPVGSTTTPLCNLLPQPHHHPYSPVNQRPELDITKRFPPFSKAPFVPFASFMQQSRLEKYLRDPFARSAWIIPVSGKLPWKEATPANLENDPTVSGSPKGRIPTPASSISWTPFVINKFWSDLLEIRKQAVLGAISLSFHAVPAVRPQVRIGKATNSARTLTETASHPQSRLDCPTSLEQCTFIKVYHNVRYAMYMRSVLDAWRTEIELPPSSVASRVITSPRRSRDVSRTVFAPEKIKVRPLLGAKLVMLDESADAVGVC